MQKTATPPKAPKKTAEQKHAEREAAQQQLRQYVNRVPATYSSWGVVRTRAWVDVHKKAASALASKLGPSAKRCQALVAKFKAVDSVPVDSLVKSDSVA